MTHPENSDQSKCSDCGSHTTYIDKTKWGIYPHWRYDPSGKQICGKCYTRASWKKRIPVGISCDFCKTTEPTKTKYGTPKWVRNRSREGGYMCRSCYITQRDTGIIFSPERRKNISIGIRRALEAGANMGPKIYAIDETVFDTITQESAYWIGELMADGYIYTGKVGNPRIALTVAEKDREHLVKFRRFLKTTYEILLKITRLNGKAWNHYTLRITSKRLAERLIKFGVTPNKSFTAKVIGLQDDRHFWRGVLDGDGYIKNRDGIDGDRIVVVGSFNLMLQLRDFIKRNILGSNVTIKQDGKFYRLYVYSYTARQLAELLYRDSHIALDRKLAKAKKMFYYIQ